MLNPRAPFKKKDVKELRVDDCYQGFLSVKRFHIQHRLFQGGWSGSLSRELLVRHDAVAVLLHDPILDAVVLIEQFRIGALNDSKSPWMLELVAGLIDTDEDPEQVAIRECEEEAGCKVEGLEKISEFYLSPGACTEKLFLYYAQIDASALGGVHGLEEEGEDIKVHVLPTKQVFSLLENGEINNAIGIIGLQWLLGRLTNKQFDK